AAERAPNSDNPPPQPERRRGSSASQRRHTRCRYGMTRHLAPERQVKDALSPGRGRCYSSGPSAPISPRLLDLAETRSLGHLSPYAPQEVGQRFTSPGEKGEEHSPP